MLSTKLTLWIGCALALLFVVSCSTPTPEPTPTPPPLAAELILANWAEDMPQEILDAFTEEYGVTINYQAYEEQSEAVQKIRGGEAIDVVVLDNNNVAQMIKAELLAPINQENIPNIKNISLNFRDLSYDPGNKYSIPYNWGTVGLVVRTDLVPEPVTQWADIFNPIYASKVALWYNEPREVMGIVLKSLGYSANSEDPAELNAALAKLLDTKSQLRSLDIEEVSSVSSLLTGDIEIAHGYAYDVLEGRQENEAIEYILPTEGVLLWGDNFVIPVSSNNQPTAELFLNYLLRPEVAAAITNHNLYATPNEAAHAFIDEAIINDPAVFPSNEILSKGEIILPLSDTGKQLHNAIWSQFLAAD